MEVKQKDPPGVTELLDITNASSIFGGLSPRRGS